MSETPQCKTCGAPLPDDAPAGLCPTCLVEAGLESAAPAEPPVDRSAAASGPRFEPPSIDTVKTLFPQLEILELLGAGGMGAVYKARQPGLDRVVALKLLPPEIGSDPAFTQRFAREAQTLARLNHPHIVGVYEFGQAGDTSFIMMEHVDGTNLRHTLETGALEPKHALVLVPQICDALQYAHDEGVVHRDIKPENILLDQKGRPKIADFGLSKLRHNANHTEASLTGTHQVMGTLRYMAPEQMEGTRDVDHRADIYSLGVVFYEMLTGELPLGRFQAPSQKVAVDVRLDDVVLRALAKEPERRYQHASDVKTAVESIAVTEGPPGQATNTASAPISGSDRESRHDTPTHQDTVALLALRDRAMGRVRERLRPLRRGQIFLFVTGLAIMLLTGLTYSVSIPAGDWSRLAAGAVMNIYGVSAIVAASVTLARYRAIDDAEPVARIQERLDLLRLFCVRSDAWLGLSWIVLWLPVQMMFGVDYYGMTPAPWVFYVSLISSLTVLIGYLAVQHRKSGTRSLMEMWLENEETCASVVKAQRALRELEQLAPR